MKIIGFFNFMLVKVFGSALKGIEATTITIEVNIDKGIGYHLVGLPDNAIKESSYRINAALKNNKYKLPGKKIIINLAPADIRKEGASYDLPIAIGILAASNQINFENTSEYVIMGELSLDGSIQPIKGILPITLKAKEEGYNKIIVPFENKEEAGIVNGITVFPASNIVEVINHIEKKHKIEPFKINLEELFPKNNVFDLDFSDVKGQESVKRAIEIAAAGGHNIILIGPPGSGKTMLAKRIPSILPTLTIDEALETTKIHSITSNFDKSGLITKRPFRSPHHTISDVALVGGGQHPQPGEISLAHNGVLFLDELPEFKRSVLEVLRQPLEDREVTISRAKFTVNFPSNFMLVASMNPSPSGYFNNDEAVIKNSPQEMQRYLNKISGPLLDRIDLHIEVNPVPIEKLTQERNGEQSSVIKKRVLGARKIQQNRYENQTEIHTNAQMPVKLIEKYCKLDKQSETLLKTVITKLNLSARAYDRILKVARTIADLDNSTKIKPNHIAEAIQYRSLDRSNWVS